MSASVTTWIGLLKAGEPEAAQHLWHRYYRSLITLVRNKLADLPKRASDEEDVVLSAFHSFCQAVDAGRFPSLENRDDLWQLLVMHAARKSVDQRRYQGRQKRSGELAGEVALEAVVGSEPDPAFAVAVADELHRMLEVLADPTLRDVALKKLEGYTNREIADARHWSPRTVERKLVLIRALWSEAIDRRDSEDGASDRGDA